MHFCMVFTFYTNAKQEFRNTKQHTPERTCFALPSVKIMRKRWSRRIKIECDFSLCRKAYVCEDHFNFEEESYRRAKLMNAMPTLEKSAMPSQGPDLQQKAAPQTVLRSQKHSVEELPTEVDRKLDVKGPLKSISFNTPDTASGSCQRKEASVGALYQCVVCRSVFSSHHVLAEHSSDCRLHLGSIYRTSTSLSADECSGVNDPRKPCAESQETAFKDVLHEKVIDDEAWLVTSLPEGYECVDAMFLVEAEGTCMLQQEIPVVPEEASQCPEEQTEQRVLSSADERTSPSEQVPAWSITLLPGVLEAEEEKEMMEQKLVLEPCLVHKAFVRVRRRLPEERLKQNSVVLNEDPKVKEEPKEAMNELRQDGTKETLDKEEMQQLVPDSSSVHTKQLRVADAQVACH